MRILFSTVIQKNNFLCICTYKAWYSGFSPVVRQLLSQFETSYGLIHNRAQHFVVLTENLVVPDNRACLNVKPWPNFIMNPLEENWLIHHVGSVILVMCQDTRHMRYLGHRADMMLWKRRLHPLTSMNKLLQCAL